MEILVAVAAADSASSVSRLDQTPIDGDKMEWKGPGGRKMPVRVFYYIICIKKKGHKFIGLGAFLYRVHMRTQLNRKAYTCEKKSITGIAPVLLAQTALDFANL